MESCRFANPYMCPLAMTCFSQRQGSLGASRKVQVMLYPGQLDPHDWATQEHDVRVEACSFSRRETDPHGPGEPWATILDGKLDDNLVLCPAERHPVSLSSAIRDLSHAHQLRSE